MRTSPSARCSVLYLSLGILMLAPASVTSAGSSVNSSQAAAGLKSTEVRDPKADPDPVATKEVITRMLQEFLLNNDDPAQHDRFWAADLVYTSGMGKVSTKADIMKDVSGAKPGPAGPKEFYSAEDILVRPYGTTAALTFRLVRQGADGRPQYYRNSGTLLLRNGRWQVVTWQATKVTSTDGRPAK